MKRHKLTISFDTEKQAMEAIRILSTRITFEKAKIFDWLSLTTTVVTTNQTKLN